MNANDHQQWLGLAIVVPQSLTLSIAPVIYPYVERPQRRRARRRQRVPAPPAAD